MSVVGAQSRDAERRSWSPASMSAWALTLMIMGLTANDPQSRSSS